MSSPRERIDLGLALACKNASYGVPMTQDEIAEWCDCTRGNIYLIEKSAMKKLRNRFQFINDPRLREAVESLFR